MEARYTHPCQQGKLKFTWICSLDKWKHLCFSGYRAHSDYGDNCYAVYVSTSRLHSKHFCASAFQGPPPCCIREWHTHTHASPVWRASGKRVPILAGSSVQPTGFATRYTLEFRKRMLSWNTWILQMLIGPAGISDKGSRLPLSLSSSSSSVSIQPHSCLSRRLSKMKR